jgi:TetR/AcrR family transcriptional regulator, cholesterol catabolism regulator
MQKIAIEEHFLLPELDDYFQMLVRDVSSESGRRLIFPGLCLRASKLRSLGKHPAKGQGMTARGGAAARRKPVDSVAAGSDGVDGVGARREQILQTAQKLFAERGFRETNLNDVATQLGFRRQAVYHYFRTKDEILYELIDRAGQAIATSAQPTLDADMPPADKLAEVVRNHVRQLLRNIDIFRIQFSELFKLHGDRADGLRRDMSAYIRSIANVIKEGQKDGVFVDLPPTTQVLLILGMCNGTVEWYADARPRLTVDQVAEYAARLALSGVVGDRPRPKAARRR